MIGDQFCAAYLGIRRRGVGQAQAVIFRLVDGLGPGTVDQEAQEQQLDQVPQRVGQTKHDVT